MRVRFCIQALALSACAVLLGAGTASAQQPVAAPTHLAVDGHLELAPGLEIFHVLTDASKTDEDAVSGSFDGTGEVRSGPVDVPIPLSLAGPVTCLNVHGSTASFLYAVDSAQPQLLNDFLAHRTSVLFTVVKGTGGAPNRIGFVGPLPTSFFHGCAPIGTPFVFNGDVALGP